MENILPYIVKNIMEDEKFLAKLNPDLKRKVDKYEAILGAWLDAAFPGLDENDEACNVISNSLIAMEEWMLTNGIMIGIKLATELCLNQ